MCVLQRRCAFATLLTVLFLPTSGLAQQSPWKKATPFPEPDEEYYGVAANGKMYVIGGWGGGKARGANYEYDPASNKWAKKKAMPRPAHHAALAVHNGKIYVFGGFVAPEKSPLPLGADWQPIDNAWEYDPAADAWKALAPLPGKLGSAVAVEVGGKIYVIGGAATVAGSKRPSFNPMGPVHVLTSNYVYDPATNKWETRRPMTVARNHAFAGAVNGKIYVIGGRTGHAFILSATNTDVVEEYNPATDMWSAPKKRMPTARSGGAWGTHGGKIYVAGGEVTTDQLVGAFRAVEAYEPATNTWTALPPMPIPRHGVAGAVVGNRFHLVSGMVTSAGVLAMSDPRIQLHTTSHDVLGLPAAKGETKAFYQGPRPPYKRYNVNTPEGKKMLAKFARAVKIMKELPDYDPHSWTFQWYTHWVDGPPAFLHAESKKNKAKVIAQLPPGSRGLAEAMWNTCQSHSMDPDHPEQFQEWFFLPWHRHYLYYFEQIVRNVLNDDDFSLPYWNPASGDPADLAIPAAFRDPKSPLYDETRFAWVNAGGRIDKVLGDWFNLNALNETFYIDSPTGKLGFCPQIDVNPHFLVHFSIGGDMATPFNKVARDPIFWVHHCNLDRAWESWNRLGCQNPTDPKWLDRKFTFADRAGKRVDVPVSAANRIAQLGYEYDNYAKSPKPAAKAAAESPPDGAKAQRAAYTRFNINSPQGQKMLAKFERAVKLMKELPDHDPHSWNFQWYTHWIDGPPAHMYAEARKYKTKAIGLLPPDSQALAEAMWNSCQAHGYNPDEPVQFQEWFFLPWHRLYLYHFEQIVREVLHDEDFSLPYWDSVADVFLPAAFRDKNSPLYNGRRNPWVNAGERIDITFFNWLSSDALNETFYIDAPTGSLGFCTRLDMNPHAFTHLAIGGDMPNFATVGRDPIFWPLHANIDRLWESWNRLGHSNPTDPRWLQRTFPFADRSRKRVDVPVSAANRIAQLGYEYDSYVQAPKRATKPAAQVSSTSNGSNYKPLQPSPAPGWTLPDGSGKSVSLNQFKGRPLVVMFYRGYGCVSCVEQLNSFAAKVRDFEKAGIHLVAISTDSPEDLKKAKVRYQEGQGRFPFPLLSDAKLEVFNAYRCTDFGNQPLHGTFLIDARGRVCWQDIGTRPFKDPAFLLAEGKQLSKVAAAR